MTRVDRRSIRLEVVERLKALRLPFGNRVFANRVRPWAPADLPGCSIYTIREDLEIFAQAPRVYRRRMELAIELVTKVAPAADGKTDVERPSDGVDDELDGMVLEVELCLERDATLGKLVNDVRHLRYEYDSDFVGRDRVSFARLIETVEYFTEAGEEPEGGLGPLRRMESTIQMGKAGPKATDRLILNP